MAFCFILGLLGRLPGSGGGAAGDPSETVGAFSSAFSNAFDQ